MNEKRTVLEGRDAAAILKYIEEELALVATATRMIVTRRPLYFSRSRPPGALGPSEVEWVLTCREKADSVIESDYVVRYRPDLEAFEITHSNSDAGPLLVGSRTKPEIGTVLPLSAVMGPPFEALTDSDRRWLAESLGRDVPSGNLSRLRYPVSLSIFVCGVMRLYDMNRWGLS